MKENTKKKIFRILSSFIGILSFLLMILGVAAVPIFIYWIKIVNDLHIQYGHAVKLLLLFLAGFSGLIIPLTSILIYSIYKEMIKRLEVEPKYLERLNDKINNKINK